MYREDGTCIFSEFAGRLQFECTLCSNATLCFLCVCQNYGFVYGLSKMRSPTIFHVKRFCLLFIESFSDEDPFGDLIGLFLSRAVPQPSDDGGKFGGELLLSI